MKPWALLLLILCASPTARADFGGHLGAHFGFGGMGDDTNGPYSSRSMAAFDMQAMPGWQIYGKTILLGLMADFRFLSQTSDGDNLQNFSGHAFSLGPGFQFDLPTVKFIATYDMLARDRYPDPTTSLQGSGFHLLFGYRILPQVFADVEWVHTRFNHRNDEDAKLDNPIVHTNIGLGLSTNF